MFRGECKSSNKVQFRALRRRAAKALFYQAVPSWLGTRRKLKEHIRRALRLWKLNFRALLKISSDAKFAALIAAATLSGNSSPHAAPPIELSAVAAGNGGYAIDGEASSVWAGWSVDTAGDVDGDGIDDFIIGAPENTALGRFGSGRAYVVFGAASPSTIQLIDIAAGSGGFAIDGEAAGDEAGDSVSGAGDVNGDGFSDVLVASPYAEPNGTRSGRCYVVFGKQSTDAVDLTNVTSGAGGFAIDGEAAHDLIGRSVSEAGDVNGDGLADIIIGSSGADPNGSYSGRSYVVFGKTDTTLVQLATVAAGVGGFVINGEGTSHFSGGSVSGAGDVNGDGLDDLLVGARGVDSVGLNNGRSYVVFGKTTTTSVDLSSVTAGVGGFAIHGQSSGDESGISVSGAGDMNGDGLADVVVGARQATANGQSSAGKNYVVFGKSSTVSVSLTSISSGIGGFVINGINYLERTGDFVSNAGDVNGDGIQDLIIGGYSASPNGIASGRAYVVFGKPNTDAINLSTVEAGTDGFVLNGEAASDSAGKAVATAGDINVDGISDVLVGAFGVPAGDRKGRTYIIYSPESPPTVAPSGLPASAIYFAHTRAGDGVGGQIVPVTAIPEARVKVNFSDDDLGSNGLGEPSTEAVTITRSKSGITYLNPVHVANVTWEITTDRTGWASAQVTFKYTDAEIRTLIEDDLAIHQLSSPGVWTALPTMIDTNRNEASAIVSELSKFVLAEPGAIPPLALRNWKMYE